MLPVIAIVGRPNVGKSTLFNRLTRSRDALVDDFPGLTRDRQYGFGKMGSGSYIVIDTGGLTGASEGIDALMEAQARRALEESDAVIMMVDRPEGLNAADEDIANLVRRSGLPVTVAVNKAEGLDPGVVSAEFQSLGLGHPQTVSASHGDHVHPMIEAVLEPFEIETVEAEKKSSDEIVITVAGRPNVGKSTLINRMIGEERLVAFDQPGTTRDSISVPFEREGTKYQLIDTAGVRRKSRVSERVEKFSIVKALQAIDKADVVISVLDAHEGITEQDVSLLGLVVARGRALVVAVNKWDGLDGHQRQRIKDEVDRRMPFLEFASKQFISALHGTGVGHLFADVGRAYKAAHADLSSSKLTQALETALAAHPPPLVRRRRIQLRYAHQGGRNPPIIVFHGNQTDRVPDSYKRYLTNYFRKTFKLQGTPIRLVFKAGKNPFAGRRNKLTPRQQRKRNRLLKKVKK